MTESGSRRGAANLAPILMILSFAAMGGLLWWLSATAVGTEAVVIDEPDEDTADAAAAALVTPEQLRMGTTGFLGQRVRLEDVPIASRFGANAFMIQLGDSERSSPFLVVLDSALIAGGTGIPEGSATVVGTVRERTDSVLDAWVESGVIPEAQRPIAEFSTHFIDATRVRGPGESSEGEDDEGGEAEGESDGGLSEDDGP